MSDILRFKTSIAFGLAFDVIRSRDRKSGFRPARFHLESEKDLLGDLRLAGFAAALRMNLVGRLVIVGRDDPRYGGERIEFEGEHHPVNQGLVIKKMLVDDHDIDAARIGWHRTGALQEGGTDKKLEFIASTIEASAEARITIITNKYHGDRTALDTESLPRPARLLAAEAIWLAESPTDDERERRASYILQCFRESLPERELDEIRGISAKICGTYRRLAERAPD